MLVGTIEWKLKLDAQKDYFNIGTTGNNSVKQHQDGYYVYFIGETHRNPYDEERRGKLIEYYTKRHFRDKVIVVIERGMAQEDLQNLDNVVYEGRTAYKSSDDLRNYRTVSLLSDKMIEIPKAGVIFIFFGEAHLDRIKEIFLERVKTKHDDAKVRWINVRSINTVIETMKEAPVDPVSSGFDVSGMKPTAYAPYSKADPAFPYLQLLEKGIFQQRFATTLGSTDVVQYMGDGKHAFAVYFKDPGLHAKYAGWVVSDGSFDVTIDGKDQVRTEVVSL